MKQKILKGILGITAEILFTFLLLGIGMLIALICWVISS